MDEPITAIPGEVATCRICRSEATLEEPLFHPCRCSGSIRNVHQECLVEWLSHSQKKHCELCKTPFRFTKLYDAEMPAVLPWGVFFRQALIHVINGTLRVTRALLVVTIWMVILPWIIRWAWRWMFWFADAGWARDTYLRELRRTAGPIVANLTTGANATWNSRAVTDSLQAAVATENGTTPQAIYDYAVKLLVSVGIETFANTTHFSAPHPWNQSDASIFSSLTYISALTPYPHINRVLLDIFEGQLITCTVIIAFILVFLIREWVVQQQPIVNLNQLREQREQAEIARRRLELLEQARRTLEELEASTAAMHDYLDIDTDAHPSEPNAESANGELRRRPRMPDRDASSRAIRVQRLIEEADAILGPPPDEADAPPETAFLDITSLQPPFSELPITNAGPDARLNIAQRRNGRATAVPAPKTPLISNEELQSRLTAITSEDDPNDMEGAQVTEEPVSADAAPIDIEEVPEEMPEVVPDETEQPALSPTDLDVEFDDQAERQPEELLRQSMSERLLDWFWGDIRPGTAPESPGTADEQVLPADDHANEAPFVPVVNGVAQPNHAAHGHDPEVLAAAEQAGLNADAVDDAEDIEGILELIGLQGPLAGLLQTSLFCLLLVVCTAAGAVVAPYVWGKAVLLVIDQPWVLPIAILRIISSIGSFLIDVSIILGSWALAIGAISTEALLGVLRTFSASTYLDARLVTRVSTSALAEARASGGRLYGMFAGSDGLAPLDVNTAFLHASVISHAALEHLKAEAATVVGVFTGLVSKLFDVVLFGKFQEVWQETIALARTIPGLPQEIGSIAKPYLDTASNIFTGLRAGNISLPSTSIAEVFDPALAYWSSTDRTLSVAAGYAALACLAAIYVAADTDITRDWQKSEKAVRDSLRQAGGVFKVILIISIEMLVFPFYCGMLLDLAFLPLFAAASITSRITFAASAPYVFCFVHWFIGTCYMFHFALFVGMCRKILRKGVLWFIRDPDDPTFHPVRDVLERNVMTQLRKIAFSALVYGALVILCLGGVIWGIGKMFSGIFPIYWTATEPTVEFPFDLLLYNFVTPMVIRLLTPSNVIHGMYAWWLRKCARMLRLSHFLFDDRRADEEGQSKNKAWSALVRFLEVPVTESPKVTEIVPHSEPGFQKDGQYVLTPCNDQYRPPKAGEAFLYVDDDDVYIADKDGKRNESFAKVYIPPFFKMRVTLFMVCLWIFSAFAGLCVTLLPLILGRQMLSLAIPGVKPNDIYAYSAGAYILGLLLHLVHTRQWIAREVRSRLARASIASLLGESQSLVHWATPYVYYHSIVHITVPMLIGLILETHLLIPLHTYFAMNAAGEFKLAKFLVNTMGLLAPSSSQIHDSVGDLASASSVDTLFVTQHTVHMVQDFALGILIMRMLVRMILSDRNSRASQAFWRIVPNGPSRPDLGLFSRIVVLPVIVLGVLTLFGPFFLASMVDTTLHLLQFDLNSDHSTLLYRFSYPATSACIMATLLLRALGKATSRWRFRIRDEVYLVGERLHNFGEKKPPVGSRSIMRRVSPAL
ncbi:hypothetical protein AMS68_000050 [Peltaster fructicola]|uniref:RING-type E3 ubiquitin transferase n=1 Tax=Peltaster fructicola TaxID=286661 RepID=A0A6H0XII1_9PEZI|nr:hypothetical protein AMS68_000050 [Peltaster fructicola]